MTAESSRLQLSVVDEYARYKSILEKFIKDRREAIGEYNRHILPVNGGFFPPITGGAVESPISMLYFSMPFIRTGGVATLNALQELDSPTLKMLAAFNHVNQVRLQKLRFNRRVYAGIFAATLGILGLRSPLLQREVEKMWTYLSIPALGIFGLLIGVFALGLLAMKVAEQLFVVRPRLVWVDEFGYLLDLAVTRARILRQSEVEDKHVRTKREKVARVEAKP